MNKLDRLNITPFSKLVKNLTALQSTKSHSKIPLVLLVTGALNPIHNGHINLFRIVKQATEKNQKFMVIAGFISPSQDQYVRKKLGNQSVSVGHRITMAKLAITDDVEQWVDVDEWEAKTTECGADITDFGKVAQDLQKWLNSAFLGPQERIGQPIRVVYLCGSDHVIAKGANNLDEIYVVGRESPEQHLSSDPSWKTKCEEKLKKSTNLQNFILFEGEDETIGISSSQIRKMCMSGQDQWEEMCPKPVAEYIKENNMFGWGKTDGIQ